MTQTGIHNVVIDDIRTLCGSDEQILKLGKTLIGEIRNHVPLSANCFDAWKIITSFILLPEHPFEIHKLLFSKNYARHDETALGPAPAWFPNELFGKEDLRLDFQSNVSKVTNVERLFYNVLLKMNTQDININKKLQVFTLRHQLDVRKVLNIQEKSQVFDLLYEISIEYPKIFWLTLFDEMRITVIGVNNIENIVSVSNGHEEWFPMSKNRTLSEISNAVPQPAQKISSWMNVAYSCFNGRNMVSPAIIFRSESGITSIKTWSRELLYAHSIAVAEVLRIGLRLEVGDCVAICMSMTPASVALYLGTILAGLTVVSIADSFSVQEIAIRLKVGKAKAIFTQDVILRGKKGYNIADRVIAAASKMTSTNQHIDTITWEPCKCIILPHGHFSDESVVARNLRSGLDESWGALLARTRKGQISKCCFPHFAAPSATTNILFSSGTTGEPKAIPWTHITPLRCAANARLLMDVGAGDVVMWPTNLGWMMGPWLIFAALLNDATIALHLGNPGGIEFIRTVRMSGTTVLGTVPSLVRSWRNLEKDRSDFTETLGGSSIRCFASTGEASNPDDALWLMSRIPGYRPIIEYCGGTEIGGAYVSGSLLQPQAPSTFSTVTFGTRVAIIDDEGNVIDDYNKNTILGLMQTKPLPFSGEIAIVTPSLGLSTYLLNRNHFKSYFEGMPFVAMPPRVKRNDNSEYTTIQRSLRRHGDMIQKLSGGYYRAIGRSDDTMNLGGIKVGNADLERVCVAALPTHIVETAAVAVSPPEGGPTKLWVIVVPYTTSKYIKVLDKNQTKEATKQLEQELKSELQRAISKNLNPLFKIHSVLLVETLPRTASNKVMRRVLRSMCESKQMRHVGHPKL